MGGQTTEVKDSYYPELHKLYDRSACGQEGIEFEDMGEQVISKRSGLVNLCNREGPCDFKRKGPKSLGAYCVLYTKREVLEKTHMV